MDKTQNNTRKFINLLLMNKELTKRAVLRVYVSDNTLKKEEKKCKAYKSIAFITDDHFEEEKTYEVEAYTFNKTYIIGKNKENPFRVILNTIEGIANLDPYYVHPQFLI